MWWNDGQAAFTRSSQRFRYSNRHGLAIGDFNGDGRPDIFAAEYSRDYRVWFNQGDGTFRTAAWPIGEQLSGFSSSFGSICNPSDEWC